MVGPSLSDDESRIASMRLKIGLVFLIGVSAGFVALAADATLPQVGIAFLGGTVVGVALTAFLTSWSREFVNVNRRR